MTAGKAMWLVSVRLGACWWNFRPTRASRSTSTASSSRVVSDGATSDSGMAVGAELSVDQASLTPEEGERLRKLLYNQRARPAPAGRLP